MSMYVCYQSITGGLRNRYALRSRRWRFRHEGKHRDYPRGEAVSGNTYSEVGQRGFYNRWQEFMNAESWKDIHVDPITAKFEGTATFHG